MMFYEKVFEQDFIEKIKAKIAEKNRAYGFNNLPTDKGNRWVGILGELALVDFLEELGLEKGINYNYEADKNDKSAYDFSIGNSLKIDVKMVKTDYYPKLNYGCDVVVSQYGKPECNSYLFGRFIPNDRKAILTGWITKDEFDAKKVLRSKGDTLNKLKAETDFYEVRIDQLQPLTSLLFYK